jgi:hypothetical protein
VFFVVYCHVPQIYVSYGYFGHLVMPLHPDCCRIIMFTTFAYIYCLQLNSMDMLVVLACLFFSTNEERNYMIPSSLTS